MGDGIVYQLQCVSDSTFQAKYPTLTLIPMRTFFVMEDEGTTAGSRIAETNRKTLGPLYAKGNVGVNVHYGQGESAGSIRVYGVGVASAKDMTKVKEI